MGRGIALLVAASVVLGSCAASTDPDGANVYGSPIGQRVIGNEYTVMVSNVWNELDAFPIAERHCKKYGKSARFSGSQGYRASFDCI